MAVLDTVLGNINRASTAVTQGLNSLSSIFSSEQGSARDIRNTYLNGFFNEGNSKFTPDVFSRLFDEPTYLTFRVEFNFDNNYYNSVNYMDYLPEPLLNLDAKNPNSQFKTPGEYYQNSSEASDDWKDSLQVVNADSANSRINNGPEYSSYDYLRNALGESRRADMLYLFVNSLKDIQNNYPYYFQSITGLGDLLKVNPTNGIRLKDGENRITIKCLEGLDLKITQLLQLYKNIVWDEVYQRWMLPDMMRYFNMKIYISEIRLFHSSSKSISDPNAGWMYNFKSGNHSLNASSYDQLQSTSLLENLNNFLNTAGAISSRAAGTNSTITNTLNSANFIVDTINGVSSDISNLMYHLCNNAINDVMPTICVDCHMCEFDIENTLAHINDLSASTKGKSATEPEIGIKIGKIYTKQLYPLNRDLSSTENEYVVNLSDDYMSGAYIDELTLSKRNFSSSDPHIALNNDKSNVVTEGRISSGLNRLGFDTNYSNNANLSYNPWKADPATGVTELATGVINVISDTSRSTAADRSQEEISNIRNNNDLTNRENMPTSSATEHDSYTNAYTSLINKYGEGTVNMALDYLYMIKSAATESKAIVDAKLDDRGKSIMSNKIISDIFERIEERSKATNKNNILTAVYDVLTSNSVFISSSKATDSQDNLGIDDKIKNNIEKSKSTSKTNKIGAFESLN